MKNLKYLLGISLFTSCFSAGFMSDKPVSRIIDGVIEVSTIPYLVSITQDGTHVCGGFIFNSKFVITTAYCIQNKPVGSMKVVVNQVSLISQDTAEEEIPVFKVTIKEDYDNSTLFNDIAIIQLSKELTLISYDQTSLQVPGPSCVRYDEVLPSQQTTNTAVFYGWGATEVDGLGAQKLRRGKVNITSSSECVNHYASDYQASNMICGQNLPINETLLVITGPCDFDEGAPLVVGDTKIGDIVVVGIYSKSQKCNVDVPGVYTRLSAHYAWINKIAGAQPDNCFSAVTTTGKNAKGARSSSSQTNNQ